MLQVPKPQVQVQVLKSNYQVQPKYRYRYVINKRIKHHLKSEQTVTRHRQS